MAATQVVWCALIIISMMPRRPCQTALEIIDSLIDSMPVVPASLWTPNCTNLYLELASCTPIVMNIISTLIAQMKYNQSIDMEKHKQVVVHCDLILDESFNCCATIKACPFLYSSAFTAVLNTATEFIIEQMKKRVSQLNDSDFAGDNKGLNFSAECKIDGKIQGRAVCMYNQTQFFECLYMEEAYQITWIDFWRYRQLNAFSFSLMNAQGTIRRCRKLVNYYQICKILTGNDKFPILQAPFYKRILEKRSILQFIKRLAAGNSLIPNKWTATQIGKYEDKEEDRCIISKVVSGGDWNNTINSTYILQ